MNLLTTTQTAHIMGALFLEFKNNNLKAERPIGRLFEDMTEIARCLPECLCNKGIRFTVYLE